MIHFKKSIVCMTIFIVYVCSFYSLQTYPPVPSIVQEFIWADNYTHHNPFANTLLGITPRINRQQSLQNTQNIFYILRSQSFPIYCEKYILPGLPHDCALIEKICADNLHYDQHRLLSKLAHHKKINEMSSYADFEKHLYQLPENIIVDPEHFKALPNAQKRIEAYIKVVNEAMKKRQNKELDALKSAHDKAKKNQSKKQKKLLNTQYDQDEKKLKAVHQQELNQGAFVTAQKKVQADCTKQYHRNMLCSMVDRNEKAKTLKNSGALEHDPFLQTIQTRNQAMSLSLQNSVPSSTTYALHHQTSGYLQAHNINPQAFTSTNGIAIQHQFTQELISVVDSVANYALQHPHETFHRDIALHCAHIASLTQQINSVENLIQVEQGVNCCRGIDHFMQGISSSNHSTREKQLTTALDFCSAVARGALQGAVTAVAVSAATAAGMALAPTATGVILGAASVATAVHIGMLCGQGLVGACTLGSYYVHGQYDKAHDYLQKTYQAMSNLENIEQGAAYASGFLTAYKGLPALQNFQKSLNMHPVIATLEQASGKVSRSLWFLTAAQVEEELVATQKILQLPEFKNFNLTCQELLGFKIFNLRPASDPKLVPLLQLADMHGLIGPKDQVTLGQIFMSSSHAGNNAVQGAISSVFAGSDSEFFTTEVGKKMYLAMTKPHEQNKLKGIVKDFQTLQSNNTPQADLDAFSKSHEMLLNALEHQPRSLITHPTCPGPHDNKEYPNLSMYFQHIFYPEIKPVLNDTKNGIQEFRLQGFHHDQYGALEKSGLFSYINPVYGDATYGAEECIAGFLDFGDGIIPKEFKTFFPQNWSREKVTQVIFEASQNIIQVINEHNSTTLYECQGPAGMIINILIDAKNCIKTAYPSSSNFIGKKHETIY